MRNYLHHISKRKRIHKKLEGYPHKNFWIRFLDRFLVILAIVIPLSTLPQIIRVYSLQSAGDLSLFTWVFWMLGNFPWILYGFVHKDKPIIISFTLWFLVNLSMVIGILIYS